MNKTSGWMAVQSKLSKLYVHDLKNPISALSANLSFLESSMETESEELLGAVADSLLAAEMLLRFAENLNLIAMMEVGELCAQSDVSLSSVLHNSLHRNAKFATSAGVKLSMEEPLEDASLSCRFRFVELTIDNLLLCGIRHSPQGSSIIVSATVDGNYARVSIRDSGRPVAPEFVDDLFTREGQVDAKTRPSSRYGRGLGLYAVGLAIEAIGGSIDVGTRDGMSEFVINVPLALEE